MSLMFKTFVKSFVKSSQQIVISTFDNLLIHAKILKSWSFSHEYQYHSYQYKVGK